MEEIKVCSKPEIKGKFKSSEKKKKVYRRIKIKLTADILLKAMKHHL